MHDSPRPLLAALALSALASCGFGQDAKNAAADEPKGIVRPLLWVVDKTPTPCYLFGTIHVPDPRVTDLHPEIDAVLEQADALYAELAFEPDLQLKLSSAGIIRDGRSLKDLLPADLYQELDQYLESKGFSLRGFDKLQPWMVTMALATLELIPMLAEGQPLDMKIYGQAKAQGREVGGVETVEEQIAVFSGGSLAEQVHLLRDTLKRMKEYDAEGRSSLKEMTALYLAGDEAKLWSYALEEMDSEDPVIHKFWKAILPDRNRVMAERAAKMMREHPEKSYVFAFGALHLVGEASVAALLREAGFTVRRMTEAPPEAAAPPAGGQGD